MIKIILKILILSLILVPILVIFKHMEAIGSGPGLIIGLLLLVVLAIISGIIFGPSIADKLSSNFIGFLYKQPGKVSRTYSIANGLLVRGKYNEAIEEYQRVIKADAKDITAQLKIAEIYDLKIRDFPQAIQEYEKLIIMKSLDANLWVSVKNRLADLYFQQKEKEKSIKQLSEVINRFQGTKYSHQAQQRISKLTGSV